MARARKRRKLPTLIDRGMGLLEVILPYGDQDQAGTFLPEGQRDTGGFWYPSGYTQPGDIFTPAQRKLQDKQREVQRHRLRRPPGHHPVVPGSHGMAVAGAAPSGPPGSPAATVAEPAERALPLPAPSLEAPAGSPAFEGSAALQPATGAGASRRPSSIPPRAGLLAAGGVVDSREGSD